MNDAIIIQQVYQEGSYLDLALVTIPNCLAYAKKHSFDYEFSYGDIVPEWDMLCGGWAKLALISGALQRGYKYVVWLDVDALIVDMDADLREACPEGIGMVIHHSPNPHYNIGCMYMTNSQEVKEFVNYWMSWYPGPTFKGSWHEQAILNLLSQTPAGQIVKEIDCKWNSTKAGHCHTNRAVVEGFHGEGSPEQRLAKMQEYLCQLK